MNQQHTARRAARYSLCALAVASALASAAAQAADDGVVLSGRMRVGIASVELEGVSPRSTYIESAGSRIDLSGQETINPDLKAFFEVSTLVCLDEQPSSRIVADCGPQAKPRNAFGNREAWVGLRGSWGSMKFGRGFTTIRDINEQYDNSLGLASGLSAWVENTLLPKNQRLDADAAVTAALAAAGPLPPPLSGALSAGIRGAVGQINAGLDAAQIPALARNIEPNIYADNAVRYDYGDWDGLRFSGLVAVGENKTATQDAGSRLSARIGYSTSKPAIGQFSIDLGVEQNRNQVVDPYSTQAAVNGILIGAKNAGTAGLAAGLTPVVGAATANALSKVAFDAACKNRCELTALAAENRTTHTLLGTSYITPVGMIAVMAGHVNRQQTGLPDLTRNNWSVNYATLIDNIGFYVGYRNNGRSKFGDWEVQDSEDKYSIGGEYRFTKRTRIQYEVVAAKIEGASMAKYYVLGLDHRF
ncbi:porin [Chitinimonas sp. BJYL2]|uniref:porin n=1 Tax=Chitinimonas sp. BJYL2 TaxID=2976696 RepID=UPI0022B435BE|nr:porin [Chitinimonas sp. BJYL2]